MFTLRDKVLSVDLARAVLDPLPIDSSGEGIVYDRYGVSQEQYTEPSDFPLPPSPRRPLDRIAPDVERARIRKWQHMFAHWEHYYGVADTSGPDTVITAPRFRKLRQRVLKGIPDGVRAEAWMRMLGSWDEIQRHETVETRVNCAFAVDHPELSAFGAALRTPVDFDIQSAIGRDVRRTFRGFDILTTRAGLLGLVRVLVATAAAVPRVGFVQSLSFVGAALLNNMTEVDAFHSFVALLRRHDLARCYSPGLPGLQMRCWTLDHLVVKHVPRFSRALENAGDLVVANSSALWATKLLLTLFFRDMPYALSIRLFDRFLVDGEPVLYRALIALLRREFAGPVCRTEKQFRRAMQHAMLPALDSPVLRLASLRHTIIQRLSTAAERVTLENSQSLLEDVDAMTEITGAEIQTLYQMWVLGDAGRLALEQSAREEDEAEREALAACGSAEMVSRAEELAHILSSDICFNERDELCGLLTDEDASALTGHSCAGYLLSDSLGDSGALLTYARSDSQRDHGDSDNAEQRLRCVGSSVSTGDGTSSLLPLPTHRSDTSPSEIQEPPEPATSIQHFRSTSGDVQYAARDMGLLGQPPAPLPRRPSRLAHISRQRDSDVSSVVTDKDIEVTDPSYSGSSDTSDPESRAVTETASAPSAHSSSGAPGTVTGLVPPITLGPRAAPTSTIPLRPHIPLRPSLADSDATSSGSDSSFCSCPDTSDEQTLDASS